IAISSNLSFVYQSLDRRSEPRLVSISSSHDVSRKSVVFLRRLRNGRTVLNLRTVRNCVRRGHDRETETPQTTGSFVSKSPHPVAVKPVRDLPRREGCV